MVDDKKTAWRALLPRGGMMGLSPQAGRVTIPMAGLTHTRLADGRTVRTLRACWPCEGETRYVTLIPHDGRILRLMDGLHGGETVEFVGRPREWRTMAGESCFAVVVYDLHAAATPASRMAVRFDDGTGR